MKISVVLIFAINSFLFAGCSTSHTAKGYKSTYSSFDLPAQHQAEISMSSVDLNFQGVPADQVLNKYQELSGRAVIRGHLPNVNIDLRSQSPLTRIQALQILDTVLAENGIVMVLSGENAVKALAISEVSGESPPEMIQPWEQLPDSSSFMMRTVRIKYVWPSVVAPVLAPYSKLPNSILCLDGLNLLVIRDYASNIRQELQMLEKMDTPENRQKILMVEKTRKPKTP